MILIMKKRLWIPILTAFFLVMVLAVSRIQTGGYAFVADTWNLDPHVRGPSELNRKFSLVSLPGGSHIDRSLDGLRNTLEGAFIRYADAGKIMRVWNRPLPELHYPSGASAPNEWSPDNQYITFGLWQN